MTYLNGLATLILFYVLAVLKYPFNVDRYKPENVERVRIIDENYYKLTYLITN